MKKQIAFKLTVAMAIAFGITIPTSLTSEAVSISNSPTYETVSTQKFYVAKTKTAIYAQANTKSKKVRTLPTNAGIVVHSTKNGFAKVRLGFNFGYIKTTNLIKAQRRQALYAKNIHETYYYTLPQNKGSQFKTTATATFKKATNYNKSSQNFWHYKTSPDHFGMLEYETAKGFYVGDIDTGSFKLLLKYPIKQSNSWTSNGKKFTIIEKNKSLRINNKVIKNVVVVKSGPLTYYIAPKKGLVKVQDTFFKTNKNDGTVLQIHL